MAEAELTLEQSNNNRIAALNAVGVGVNGINESLVIMMLEDLLGEEDVLTVKHRHQVWLSQQLDGLEHQVAEVQRKSKLQIPKGSVKL